MKKIFFINFKFFGSAKLVGPVIRVVSIPFFNRDFAISYPCLPLELFVINHFRIKIQRSKNIIFFELIRKKLPLKIFFLGIVPKLIEKPERQ